MMEIRRIVAATDLSDCSAAALPYAREIAEKYGSELTLLHVNVVAPHVGRGPANLAYAVSLQVDGARSALDEFQAAYLRDMNVERIVVNGTPSEVILSTSRVLDADLIVMGTRGHSGIRRALLGSVAEMVIRNADRPVLTARCPLGDQRRSGKLIRRILCPVSYNRGSGRAFDRALALASALDAELVVLFVAEESVHGAIDAEAEIERLRDWIGEVTMPVTLELLTTRGDAAEQVIFYAKQHETDLLVIGSRRKSIGNETVLGSTTERLTRHAPCAVLTVPSH